ncbi:hypothetical protein K7X08_036756 [Anisodus acutangulus]|uniref:Uncharacterized protein n=1 Tax=Anisodus acutangulus TaxID=402998 RepID=A0A9Q1L7D8_9SOLA|nr:hypothetical protein K7X08_036756 [Anisodus acutangulus]
MASSSKIVIMAIVMILTMSMGQATAARRLQQAGGFPGGFPSFPRPTTPSFPSPSGGGLPGFTSFPMPTTPSAGGFPDLPSFPFPPSFPTTPSNPDVPAQTTTP